MLIFFVCEYGNRDADFITNLTDAWVLSTMTRTAGFNTVDLCGLMPLTLTVATLFLLLLQALMVFPGTTI